MDWFQRHLNWTWLLASLIWIPLNASDVERSSPSILPVIVGNAFLLVASVWIITNKRRSLWWILLIPIFSPLWLSTKKETLTNVKSRPSIGLIVQIIGWILYLWCGILILIWSWGIITDAVGTWLAVIAMFLFPVLFVFVVPIAWFITGLFPWNFLIVWLLSLLCVVIINIGGSIKEGDFYQ